MVAQRTPKKLILGREIEHMMNTAGLSQTEVAALLETRQSRIADLIAGSASITVGDLERLANKLGFTDEGYQATLLELRRDNNKRGFWSTGYNRVYDEDFRLMVDLEKHADQLRAFQIEIMPGLTQCESYIRALFAEISTVTDSSYLEDAVHARLARQKILFKDDAPQYHAVISESCLRREYGGTKVMREQIEHLTTLSKLPNVLLQVIPFKIQPRGIPTIGSFALIRVPSPGIAGPLELAYLEGYGEIRYLDDKRALAAHDRAWSRFTASALSSEDTRKFMRHVATSFR